MKKVFLFLTAVIGFGIYTNAQDVITLKNGTDINALVQEIDDIEVKYKKINNPNGPNYTLKKAEILIIRYENGAKDIFAEETKHVETKDNANTEKWKTIPNNQNAKQKLNDKNTRQQANRSLNGHYISLGSSILSNGIYGSIIGLGYEYRYKIVGINFSVGYQQGPDCVNNSNDIKFFSRDEQFYHPNGYWYTFGANAYSKAGGISANVGLKIYLSSKKPFLRNLYFNFLPLCYTWQPYYAHPFWRWHFHIFQAGLFIGYSPVWYVNNKVALGFNIDIGTKITYGSLYTTGPELWSNSRIVNIFSPINWDLGFVVKF